MRKTVNLEILIVLQMDVIGEKKINSNIYVIWCSNSCKIGKYSQNECDSPKRRKANAYPIWSIQCTFLCSHLLKERDNGPSQLHTHLLRVLEVFPTDFASRKFMLWKQLTNLRRRTPSVTQTVDAHSLARACTHTHTYVHTRRGERAVC